MLKLVVLKSWKTFHYIWKPYSNLLSNPRRGWLALEAEKPKNDLSKKLLKFVTYYQTLKDVFWSPSPGRPEKWWGGGGGGGGGGKSQRLQHNK